MTIATASRAYHSALRTASDTSLRRRDEERQLQLVESLLAQVEAHNLSGHDDVPSSMRFAVHDAATVIEARPPRALWKVSSSGGLHDALLEWQGRLLDAFRPKRLEFDDRFDRG